MTPKDNISAQKRDNATRGDVSTYHSEKRLFPHIPDSCELSIACFRSDFCASVIARAVEDCDAHLLNLNITDDTLPSGEMVVDLRISHRQSISVSRSLERYGYRVIAIRGELSDDYDTIRSRAGELLALINV